MALIPFGTRKGAAAGDQPQADPLGDMLAADSPRARAGAMDLDRITVDKNGRLFWDGKPVVVRRRLVLSGWQTFGAWLIGLAAITIALSGAVLAAIQAHDWMCSARWVSGYCTGVTATPVPPPPAKPKPPELPT
jgi:hypothetical protein